MTSRGTPNRFLQSVLRNGVGRYICQLKRLTLVFSKTAGNSRGARDFVEENILDFAKRNPSIVMYVTPHQCSHPKIIAEYLNGSVKEELITSKTAEEIVQQVQKMANQSGLDIIRIRKLYHTFSPSIQGQWHPFINKPPCLNVKPIETVNQNPQERPK